MRRNLNMFTSSTVSMQHPCLIRNTVAVIIPILARDCLLSDNCMHQEADS